MMGLDRVEVRGIKAWAHHGVFDHERRDGQAFVVDLAWWQDFSVAATTDDLASTVDYAEVVAYVVELLQGCEVNLIETLAVRIRDAVMSRFSLECLQVSVHKPEHLWGWMSMTWW